MTAPDPTAGGQGCPTCGPTTIERHPRRTDVTRCANCKEWLTLRKMNHPADDCGLLDCPRCVKGALSMLADLTTPPATDRAVATSTGTSEDVEALIESTEWDGWKGLRLFAPRLRKWAAAREAAARAEERERVAQAIEAHADRHAPAHTRRTFVAAARIAREGR